MTVKMSDIKNLQVKEKVVKSLVKIVSNISKWAEQLNEELYDLDDLLDTTKFEISHIMKKNSKLSEKREWYSYRLPSVLLEAANKRGFTTWGDLALGSKDGFRNNILKWAYPKVNKTYQKRINAILNRHYKKY